MRRRYPFDALHWLRQERVTQKATTVSESVARTVQARLEHAGAKAARLSQEQAIAELRRTEQACLEEGQMRVADLLMSADFRAGAEAELALKAEREASAHNKHVAQLAAEAAARRALGVASNEAKLIDEHRSTFQREQAALGERIDEEAAAEQWSAAHFVRRS